MYNCYAVFLAGKQFAIFKTEQAAQNFITVMNERTSVPYSFTVRGLFIDNIGF